MRDAAALVVSPTLGRARRGGNHAKRARIHAIRGKEVGAVIAAAVPPVNDGHWQELAVAAVLVALVHVPLDAAWPAADEATENRIHLSVISSSLPVVVVFLPSRQNQFGNSGVDGSERERERQIEGEAAEIETRACCCSGRRVRRPSRREGGAA